MKTIAEKSKVIAEFMGQEYDHIAEDGCLLKQNKNLGQAIICYHAGWDDLMPVIEKIIGQKPFPELNYTPTINGWDAILFDNLDGMDICESAETLIEATHEAIYQFIIQQKGD